MNNENPISFSEKIDLEKREFEFIITNMRLKEGLNLKVYQDKFGINLYAKNKKLIDNWINRGLLTLDNNHLCFSNQGFFVSNSFFVDILV